MNTKNPDDVVKIFPWLVPTETMTRMEVATDIYKRLKDEPEKTLLLVAIERNITRAIFVAYISTAKIRKFVILYQAQLEEEFKYINYMIEFLKAWARKNKAREIRFENNVELEGTKYKIKL